MKPRHVSLGEAMTATGGLNTADRITLFNWLIGVMYGRSELVMTCATVDTLALAELVNTAQAAYRTRLDPKPETHKD